MIFIVNPNFCKLRNALTWELQAKVAWCCWKCVAALTFWMIGWSPWSWQSSTPSWTRSFYVQVHAICVAIPENLVDTMSRLQGIMCFIGGTVLCWVLNLQLEVFASGGFPFLWFNTEGAGRGKRDDLNIDVMYAYATFGNEIKESSLNSCIELFTHAHLLESFAKTCGNKSFCGCGAGQRFSQGEYWWTCKKHLRYLKSPKPQRGKQRRCLLSVGGIWFG